MADKKPTQLCDHPGHKCHSVNGLHRMMCACGCDVVVEVHDMYRLRVAPGFGGGWYAHGHGTNLSPSQPGPAGHVEANA